MVTEDPVQSVVGYVIFAVIGWLVRDRLGGQEVGGCTPPIAHDLWKEDTDLEDLDATTSQGFLRTTRRWTTTGTSVTWTRQLTLACPLWASVGAGCSLKEAWL